MPNRLITRSAIPLHPVKALLIYGPAAKDHRDHGGNNHFATVHTVRDGEIMEGAPLDTKSFLSALGSLSQERPLTYLDDGILAVGTHALAFWIPSGRTPMFFSTKDDAINKFNGVTLSYPPLVFILRPGGAVTVFALRDNKRPTPTTRLHRAPFFNLYEDGALCVGSAPFPHAPSIADREAIIQAFFHSQFTHSNCGPVSKIHYPALLALMARKRALFPVQHLKPTKHTLASCLNKS